MPIGERDSSGDCPRLTIPQGFFNGTTFLPVPNAFPIIQLVLTGPGGGLTNQSIMMMRAGSCDAGHLTTNGFTGNGGAGNGKLRGVRCPGGNLAGFGGLGGSALVSLFFTPTAGTQPVANLQVPLSRVGAGSVTMTTSLGIVVTLTGAGWTTGTATIYNPTVAVFTHIPSTSHFFPTISFLASESVVVTTGGPTFTMGRPLGFTHTAGSGAGTRLGIQLVSPALVLNNATGEFADTRLKITLTPEPGELLLIGLGGVAFSLYGGWRMREIGPHRGNRAWRRLGGFPGRLDFPMSRLCYAKNSPG